MKAVIDGSFRMEIELPDGVSVHDIFLEKTSADISAGKVNLRSCRSKKSVVCQADSVEVLIEGATEIR